VKPLISGLPGEQKFDTLNQEKHELKLLAGTPLLVRSKVKRQTKTVSGLSRRLKRQSCYWNWVQQVDNLYILKNQSINESETTQNLMASMLMTFAMKIRTQIACWNMRTLLESSRLNQAATEM
jgi:hypothetical protein